MCGAFSKNLSASASPNGAAPTKIVSTDFKCSCVTFSLLARKDTTGGARCRTVGYMEIDKYLSKLLDSIEDIKICSYFEVILGISCNSSNKFTLYVINAFVTA